MICVQNGRSRYRQAKSPTGDNRTGQLKSAFRRHPVLVSAFVAFTLLALFFAGRFTYQAIYWSTHQNQPVAAWMTVGYIAHSWNLDPRDLDGHGRPAAARRPSFDARRNRRRSAACRCSEIIAAVEAAIAKLQAEKHGHKPP